MLQTTNHDEQTYEEKQSFVVHLFEQVDGVLAGGDEGEQGDKDADGGHGQASFRMGDQQDDGAQEELVKLSFLRAMFASELVVLAHDMPISRSEGYLLGMFSTLDKLMDISLDEALEQLPISDEIKNGLLKGEGKAGTLLSLVLSYEKADWRNMSTAAEELGIPSSLIAQKYFECVENVNDIWNSLTQANDNMID